MAKRDNHHNDTYVIIPVYNEAVIVGEVLEKLAAHFTNIVCVDDGSSDDSARLIDEQGIAQTVKHPINLGQGAALQTGVDYALQDPGAKYFITFDSDGQHSSKDAEMLLSTLKTQGVDIVLGSRFLGNTNGLGMFKKIVLKAAIAFSNYTSGLTLTDAHNGLRAFNRHFAENLNLTMADMTHASEFIHRIVEGSFTYQEHPVTIEYTDYSKSKGQPILNSVNISFDLLLNRLTKK